MVQPGQKGQSDHSPANAEAFFRHIRIKPFFDCQLAQAVPQGKLFCCFGQKDRQFVADRQTYTTFYRGASTLQNFRVFYRRQVSGLPVEPIYYSQGEAIGLIAAEALLTQKEAIAEFVAKHPTEEGKKLQKMLETMNEESGSVLCFVKLK